MRIKQMGHNTCFTWRSSCFLCCDTIY